MQLGSRYNYTYFSGAGALTKKTLTKNCFVVIRQSCWHITATVIVAFDILLYVENQFSIRVEVIAYAPVLE